MLPSLNDFKSISTEKLKKNVNVLKKYIFGGSVRENAITLKIYSYINDFIN